MLLNRPTVALLIIAILLPSAYWILHDYRVWPWDQALYGEVTLDIFRTFSEGVVSGIGSMLTSLNFKPPGLVWLAQPFVFLEPLLGRMEPSLLFAVLLSHGILLAALYYISINISKNNAVTAISSVVFIASTPIFIGLSHQFFVEPFQSAVVALSYGLLIAAERLPFFRVLSYFIILVSLSVLVKTTTFIYNGLPLFIVFIQLLGNRGSWKKPVLSKIDISYIAVSIVLFSLTMAWYFVNAETMFEHVKNSSLGSVALDYGSEDAFFNKMIFWLKSIGSALFSMPLLLWAFVAVLLIGGGRGISKKLVAGNWGGTSGESRVSVFLVGSAAAHVFLVLIVLSLQINEETRLLEPILTPVFILVAYSLTQLGSVVVPALFAGLSMLQWGGVHGQVLKMDLGVRSYFPWVVVMDESREKYQMLSEVVDITCSEENKNEYAIIGVEYSWLNHNSAGFFSAKNALNSGYRCKYTSLGYAADDVDLVMERFHSFAPEFFISMQPSAMVRPLNYLNKVSIPVFHLIDKSPLWRRIDSVSPDLVVFKSKAGLE